MSPRRLLALLFAPGLAAADPVIAISDGDTLTVLRGRRPVKVRLAEVDAPELHQPFGAVARRSLGELCFRAEAELLGSAHDRYGRLVAHVRCRGVDAGREQVRRGLAWAFARYVVDGSLFALERQARRARRGLWIDPAPVPPWAWRRGGRRPGQGRR